MLRRWPDRPAVLVAAGETWMQLEQVDRAVEARRLARATGLHDLAAAIAKRISQYQMRQPHRE